MATALTPGQAAMYPEGGGIMEEEKEMQKAITLITDWPAPSHLPGGEVRPVLLRVMINLSTVVLEPQHHI